jgi:hypothetical protein
MDDFGNLLRAATLVADSPDGTVRITAHGDGRLDVSLDNRKLSRHDETTLAEQIEAIIVRLLRANVRNYVEAWRTTSTHPDGLPAERVPGDEQAGRPSP